MGGGCGPPHESKHPPHNLVCPNWRAYSDTATKLLYTYAIAIKYSCSRSELYPVHCTDKTYVHSPSLN